MSPKTCRNVSCKRDDISDFLADTWWFGLSQRLSETDFNALAALRAEQGFSAIQLVVGVPPEVGPENKNARSQVGFPWTLGGDFNPRYLALAQKRIKYLNDLDLLVVVYGAWGHQIEWLGKEKMAEWWLQILETLDALDVVYCLCGESDLWVGEAAQLLPARSTDDLGWPKFCPWGRRSLGKAYEWLRKRLCKHLYQKRRTDWSFVLEAVSQKTFRPIIVHPTAGAVGYETVYNSELLSANTVQTGHDASTRNLLWQLPLALLQDDRADKGIINLEPWYEGIRDQFWTEDQVYAYWVTMLAGATSYCYGAHGIWNVGDGKFLAHWGKQTFAQAMALDTPRLLGLSHEQRLLHDGHCEGKTFYQVVWDRLVTIGKRTTGGHIQFFPDIARVGNVPRGRIWLPLEGVFANDLPQNGQVVIFAD